MKLLLSLIALLASAMAVDIPIAVGQGDALTFTPSVVNAAVGDKLIFSFYSDEHAVAQSASDKPCQPMNGTFYSGTVTGTHPPQISFTYTLTSTDPIYYYCPVHRHCQAGMVGIISPPDGNTTFSSYAALSKNASGNIAPKLDAGTGGVLMNGTDSTGNGTTTVNGTVVTSTSTVVTSSSTGTSSASTTSGTAKSGAEKMMQMGNGLMGWVLSAVIALEAVYLLQA